MIVSLSACCWLFCFICRDSAEPSHHALGNLLGNVRFVGIRWSAILVIAFCGIDFAGLLHIFAPQTTRSPLPEQLSVMNEIVLVESTTPSENERAFIRPHPDYD